jgi:GxxExxY protein
MHNDSHRSYGDHRSDSRGGDRNGDRNGGRRGRGVPLSDLDPALTAASHKVIGAARDVHMALGPGYPREVYLNALIEEFNAQAIPFRAGHTFDIAYKGVKVGAAKADLYVNDRFVVTVLAAPGEVGSYERAELRAQLKAGGLELGLIINFAGRLLKDGLVRVLNPDKIPSLRNAPDEHGSFEDDASSDGGAYDPDAKA